MVSMASGASCLTATTASVGVKSTFCKWRTSTAVMSIGVAGNSRCRYLCANADAGPPIGTIRSGGPLANMDNKKLTTDCFGGRARACGLKRHFIKLQWISCCPLQLQPETCGESVKGTNFAPERMQQQHAPGLSGCRTQWYETRISKLTHASRLITEDRLCRQKCKACAAIRTMSCRAGFVVQEILRHEAPACFLICAPEGFYSTGDGSNSKP